jgi:hypothetical protein
VILAAISTASVMAPTVNDFANKAALRPIGRQSSPCRSHHLSRSRSSAQNCSLGGRC